MFLVGGETAQAVSPFFVRNEAPRNLNYGVDSLNKKPYPRAEVVL